ncbi:PD-(D/E)XK nuclease family protein [Ruminococcus sp.]|uniref:PD-(D/E)XK nuclease family protein n=1 Tax=Ruminococcus sp. TaxID=41978 RepID=UPI0025FB2550|nr:PD-(D/E)XK nuclease family protein [Ruminococcus sp.]MBQ8965149.1 PD-(D/E)XK nuclease family protein [Ruminococcus sp.]
MKEKICLIPSANGTEFMRSLAKRGVCPAGLRIVDGTELARLGLAVSGKSVKGRLISPRSQAAAAGAVMKDIEYFRPAAYTDAQLLASALDKLRGAADDDVLHEKLPEGLFADKNAALLEALDAYENHLEEQGLTDRITVMRQALAECEALDGELYEFLYAEGYPLSPLESRLLEKLSGGKAECVTLAGLYGAENAEPKAEALTEAYGASNEAEDIIDCIFKKGLPLDSCLIAVTDTAKYSQLFSEVCGRYDIPLTLGCGTLLTSTYPAKLLSLIRSWAAEGCFGIDGLSDMLFSEAFDRKKLYKAIFPEKEEHPSGRLKAAVRAAGELRLGFDREMNSRRIREYSMTLDPASTDKDVIEQLAALKDAEALFEELGRGAGYIIDKYAVRRRNALGAGDKAAAVRLGSQLRELVGEDITEVIPQLLKGYVRPENSCGGALHLVSVENAVFSMRENIFIAGLSADNFPGERCEDHLVLDCDCELFEKGALPTSAEDLMRRREQLFSLMSLAAGLGCKVRLSYYNYELSELKDENPSSVIDELSGGQDIEKRKAGFFTAALSVDAAAGRAYIDGRLPAGKAAEKSEDTLVTDLRKFRKFSPSAIEVFFQCPKHFLLESILGIRPAESDDPLEILAANDQGTLLHKVMEESAGDPHMTKDDILALAGGLFDGAMKRRPPMHDDRAAAMRHEFMEMAENAFAMNAGDGSVVSAEEAYSVEHEKSGLTLYGLPDRVAVNDKGEATIIDYKSGRKVKHIKDDIDSCLQTVIYAYMLRQQGLNVTGCEYRYVRKNEVVPCRYDSDMEQKLDSKLAEFAEALKNCTFECNPGDDNCKYCRLGGICGKEETV